MKSDAGFTLLEVLVALAILAFALAAATRAGTGSADTVASLHERQLAGWVAENRLAWLRGTRQWPTSMVQTGREWQVDREFLWQIKIEPTQQTLFRRVEIHVFSVSNPDAPLMRLVSFLAMP